MMTCLNGVGEWRLLFPRIGLGVEAADTDSSRVKDTTLAEGAH